MESLTNSVLLFFEFNFTMLRKKGLPEEKKCFKAFETRKKAPNKFSFSKCSDTKKLPTLNDHLIFYFQLCYKLRLQKGKSRQFKHVKS